MNIKRNKSGVLFSGIVFGKKYYFIYTRQGHYRGGKQRSVEKRYILLTGKALSHTVIRDKVEKNQIQSRNIYDMPAHAPHLLFFEKNSWFVEWWNADYQEEDYQPFRDMKIK